MDARIQFLDDNSYNRPSDIVNYINIEEAQQLNIPLISGFPIANMNDTRRNPRFSDASESHPAWGFIDRNDPNHCETVQFMVQTYDIPLEIEGEDQLFLERDEEQQLFQEREEQYRIDGVKDTVFEYATMGQLAAIAAQNHHALAFYTEILEVRGMAIEEDDNVSYNAEFWDRLLDMVIEYTQPAMEVEYGQYDDDLFSDYTNWSDYEDDD